MTIVHSVVVPFFIGFCLFYSYHLLFVISFPVKPCIYDNQTFGINHSIITLSCQEICGCNFRNGVTITTCELLCEREEDPMCNQHSQVIEEYQTPLNGSSCICTRKKCVADLILFLVETL